MASRRPRWWITNEFWSAWLWLYDPYGLDLKKIDSRFGSERLLCIATQPMEGNTALSGVSCGYRAEPNSACGASSSSRRASSSLLWLRAYQRARGEGANAASALPTRDHTSVSCISNPSPNAPEGAPGGTK